MSDPSATARLIAEDCIAMRARVLSRIVGRIYDDALRPFGLKAAQLNLLVGISLAGPVRPGDLAAWFQLEKSTMSRNIQRMLERDWVAIGEMHGRSQSLTLTDAGVELLESVRPAWEAAQAKARARLESTTLDGLMNMAMGTGDSHSSQPAPSQSA